MTRKTVLVTGGAKRIGAEIARCFADAGWHVVIHYNASGEAARDLVDTLPSAETVQCDLFSPLAAAAMVRSLAARLEDWRCLVNNASIFVADEVTGLDPAANGMAMTINATTPALMAETFLSEARSTAGRRVINITDQKLANPNPDFFGYSMSKAALDMAARMQAMAVSGEDRVYTLAPGAILPSHDQTPEEADQSHRRNLLQRRTTAVEVAEAAVFLAEGPLATGQSIFVDSGQHLLRQSRDVIYLEREGPGS